MWQANSAAAPTAQTVVQPRSAARLAAVLDATHGCLLRHGVRKTTMDDIARAAGMSRPAVYQYVRNKDDAFRRLAARLCEDALAEARAAAARPGTLAQRLDQILAVKLRLQDPAQRPYAVELFAAHHEVRDGFVAAMTQLLTETITAAAAEAGLALSLENAREVAVLALALTRGLEAEVQGAAGDHAKAQPGLGELARERLRNGTALLVAGLAATVRPAADAATGAEAGV